MVVFSNWSLYNKKKETGMENTHQPAEQDSKTPLDATSKPQERKTSRWNEYRWYQVRNCSDQGLPLSEGNSILINPGHARAFSGRDMQGFDETNLRIMEESEKITIKELEYDPEKEYSIKNLKKEPITIRHNIFSGSDITISGLDSRRVGGETLLELDYLEALSKGLIQIEAISRWVANRWYRVKNFMGDDLVSDKGYVVIKAKHARAISGRDLEEFDQKKLSQMEGRETITIRELECDPDKEYTITNLTTERISIKHNLLPDTEFFVPASGSREVNGKTLLHIDYLLWESQGLIQIDPLPPAQGMAPSTTADLRIGLTITALFFFLVVSIPYALRSANVLAWIAIGISILATYFVVRGLYKSLTDVRKEEFNDNVKNWARFLPGITLILVTGIGLPLYFLKNYGPKTLDLTSLQASVLLQVGFISIASMLPAFLFYLFGRQQVREQRENFYREAMLLDPNVWSQNEARNKYGPLFNTIYDTGKSPLAVVLLVITTGLLVTGWMIALSPLGSLPDRKNILDFFVPPYASAFTLGFLGAYFFSINLVYRRYVRADLSPKTYAYLAMRLITTFVLVWAVSILPRLGTSEGLPALAFTIGIFPESALTLIQDYVNRLTAILRKGRNQEQFALTRLEGINLYDQARLMEEGIENIENLAHHNLMELIARTRIPTARLVDMFDQAILYLHLGLEEDESKPDSTRNLLKALGVRTATDLLACRKRIAELEDEKYNEIKKKLNIIVVSLQDDEWLNYIRCWRDNSSTKVKTPINDAYKFYVRAIGIEDAKKKEETLKEAGTPREEPKPVQPVNGSSIDENKSQKTDLERMEDHQEPSSPPSFSEGAAAPVTAG
jgi:hypothetical protein